LAAATTGRVHYLRNIAHKTFEAGSLQHPPLLSRLLEMYDVGEVGQARGALLAVPAPVGIVGGSLGGQKVGDELGPSWPCHPS